MTGSLENNTATRGRNGLETLKRGSTEQAKSIQRYEGAAVGLGHSVAQGFHFSKPLNDLMTDSV